MLWHMGLAVHEARLRQQRQLARALQGTGDVEDNDGRGAAAAYASVPSRGLVECCGEDDDKATSNDDDDATAAFTDITEDTDDDGSEDDAGGPLRLV